MTKVKQVIFFVLILTQICWLQAAPGDNKKGSSSKGASAKGAAAAAAEAIQGSVNAAQQGAQQAAQQAAMNALAQIPPGVIAKAAADFVLKSSFVPRDAKVAVAFGRMSWAALNSFQDGKGMKEVAIVSLESAVQSAADVYSNSGGAGITVGYGIMKDIAQGKNAKTVLKDAGKNLIRSHLPGYEYAESAYMFMEEARKTNQNLTSILNKGTEAAQKQVKDMMRERYGNHMDLIIDTAISTTLAAKDSKSSEEVAQIFVQSGTALIENQREAILKELNLNLPEVTDIAGRVTSLVDGGMTYEKATEEVRKIVKEKVKENQAANLLTQIECGIELVNQIAKKKSVDNLVDLVIEPSVKSPADTKEYVREKAKDLCMRMPGAWPDCGSDSESDSKSKGKNKPKK